MMNKKKYLSAAVIFLVVIFVTASLVYSQSNPSITKHPTSSGNKTEDDISFTTGNDHIYHIAGNLNVSKNQTGNQTGVVFVDENLNFTGNYTYGTALTGAVFIVKGDINIDPTVTRVDAVLIAEGTIYTEGTGCTRSSPPAGSQLTINGSLISLNPDKPPRFCRTLSDNTQPAEKINHQPKYVVILRHLLSDTLQRWSEIP